MGVIDNSTASNEEDSYIDGILLRETSRAFRIHKYQWKWYL